MKNIALIALAALSAAHAAPTRTATEGYVDRTVAAATNGLADKADAAYSAAESLADGVNSLAGTIGTHIRDTKNPHNVTAAQVGALPLNGGTLTGDLEVGEMNAASRKLTIAADNGATGITMTGGTSTGNGSTVVIGGSENRGGALIVNMGLNYGGRINVLGGLTNGRGGAILVTGNGASISAKGTNASITKGDDEVATEKYVNTQVSGVESTLTMLAGAVNAKADASSVYTKTDIDEQVIAASNQTFSNAVLAVGLNIDTNSVAVLNEIAETFGGFPIEGAATTVGGLLAALAAAVAWMKKNKVGSFASVGGASTTVENGVAELDDFFTESNSLLTGTIDARLPYPLYDVTDETGLLKDRAINTTSLASVTVPDNFTDLLVRASVASSLSVTMPEAITKYGDTFPGEAGEYLITITKTGAAEAYVRTIKLEVANA